MFYRFLNEGYCYISLCCCLFHTNRHVSLILIIQIYFSGKKDTKIKKNMSAWISLHKVYITFEQMAKLQNSICQFKCYVDLTVISMQSVTCAIVAYHVHINGEM